MKTMSFKAKLMAGLITGSIILSTAGTAFAASNTATTANATTSTTQSAGRHGGKGAGVDNTTQLTAELKTAVNSKIITQAESDKIIAYVNSKTLTKDKTSNNGTQRTDFFNELVTNKIITQAKADALKVNQEAQRSAQMQKDLTASIKTLVTDKTLTQDQADKITVAITSDKTAEQAAMKADKAKVAAMTEAQRKTFMDSQKANDVDPLKALVTNETITQAQADKVNALLPQGGKGHGGPGQDGRAYDGKTGETSTLAK